MMGSSMMASTKEEVMSPVLTPSTTERSYSAASPSNTTPVEVTEATFASYTPNSPLRVMNRTPTVSPA